jgi:ATP-dependent exoDNAse (exonuclease V) beta subunit
VARRASGEKEGVVAAAQVFALTAAAAAELGTAVHGLLAQVEWLEQGDDEARWRERWTQEPVSDEALVEAWRCVQAAELAGVWARPPGAAEVWRERAFEILLDGAWITGVFDRVIVRRDTTGGAREAVVFDFKTDRVGNAAEVARATERHRPQLALYRRVVAVLTGLPIDAVRAELVFSAMGTRAIVAD